MNCSTNQIAGNSLFSSEIMLMLNTNYLLTESKVFTGNYQTEALPVTRAI